MKSHQKSADRLTHSKIWEPVITLLYLIVTILTCQLTKYLLADQIAVNPHLGAIMVITIATSLLLLMKFVVDRFIGVVFRRLQHGKHESEATNSRLSS